MLKIHRLEDSKYDMNWVVANNSEVMINRFYIERHEPTYSGISIIVQNPNEPEWLMEYGHNEEGFMSVSDFTNRGKVYEIVSIDLALRLLEINTQKALGENK